MQIAVEANESEGTDEDGDEERSGGALAFAREEAEQNRITKGILDKLPSRKMVFVVGAATGSVTTAVFFALAIRLWF